MVALLEGGTESTFRGTTTTVGAGTSVNIPANAPHHVQNRSGAPVRMLCTCTPAGQVAQRRGLAAALAAQYDTEVLPPT